VDTPRGGVAAVVGAGVAVVAVSRRAGLTRPATAHFPRRTGIAVGAWRRVVRVDTATRGVARVRRAHVAVIAGDGREQAAARRIAGVRGAGVPVVAGEEGAQGEVEQGGGETLRGAGVEDHLVEAAEGEAHAGEIEATLEELGRIEDVVPILVLSRPGGCQQRAVDDRT